MFKYLIFYYYEKDEFVDGHGIAEVSFLRKINSAKDIKALEKQLKAKFNYLSVSITGYNQINES